MGSRLRQAIKKIQYANDALTIEKIASSIGYSRAYFTTLINSKSDSDQVISLLETKYPEIKQIVPSGKPSSAEDEATKDKIILQLVEHQGLLIAQQGEIIANNGKLVNNVVDLTQMAKENWAMKHGAEETLPYTGQVDPIVLKLLARIASRDKFQSEAEALSAMLEDAESLYQEYEAKNAQTRSGNVKQDHRKLHKTAERGIQDSQ